MQGFYEDVHPAAVFSTLRSARVFISEKRRQCLKLGENFEFENFYFLAREKGYEIDDDK